jgi:hypothetical protein
LTVRVSFETEADVAAAAGPAVARPAASMAAAPAASPSPRTLSFLFMLSTSHCDFRRWCLRSREGVRTHGPLWFSGVFGVRRSSGWKVLRARQPTGISPRNTT